MITALTEADMASQAKLKESLQREPSASKLENLAAALLGHLLDVPIAVAKSGFQHGGDAGPAGRQGRRFRIESKKYSDTTSLSDRELLGEIDHALSRDLALEAWVLVATRNVSEQLELDLTQKGEQIGVPVIIIDWKDGGLSSLAALCAFAPDIVAEIFSKDAGKLARSLQPVATGAIELIRRNLQSWNLGFESLRSQSHKKLMGMWESPKISNAELGQDAAGGAQPKKVRRTRANVVFNSWWVDKARSDAPLAVIGWDGVGKTWATLDWLVSQLEEQPIVLIVPSSAAAELTGISEARVKRFLADRLYELGGNRDRAHWLRRIDFLLNRPTDEGPVFTVFFDGLNQEPSVSWIQLLKVLQGPIFEGKVRVITSTRNHYFNNKLSELRGLIVAPVIAIVDEYDSDPGGELDQMLAFENLTQADLHPDLIELAQTPRLFKLVIRFRERLIEAGQVTIHRLLWEYGRDTFGERAGRSFSEDEWRDWLKEIARTYRSGVRDFSVKTLGETTSRTDLTEREVFSRLSDIIDGRFARREPSGVLRLSPTVVSHALGAALLWHLGREATGLFETIETKLSEWLDPIAGLDQRAEILRAAVSILVERGESTFTPIAGVLVTAWLQTQNVTDQHRRELAALAGSLLSPLLDAVEHSCGTAYTSARLWGVNALRTISRSDVDALAVIVNRLKTWFYTMSRDIDNRPDVNADIEKRREERFIKRVGVDASGPLTILGLPVEFVDRDDGILCQTTASILEGFPLALAVPVFEAAAVSLAVVGHNGSWDGLKWLCLLNEIDPENSAAALRSLAQSVQARSPEFGVNPVLAARVAALLLWLTGFQVDEEEANRIDPGIDHFHTYEEDYLSDPSRSIYPLERRHAQAALLDTDLTLYFRIQRTKGLWLDPTFEPAPSFVAEVRAAAGSIDVEKLHRFNSYTAQDHAFEEFAPVLARCAPDLLADIARRWMLSFGTCVPVSRYWCAIHATDQIVLVDGTEAKPARSLRFSAVESDASEETYAASQLLILEIREMKASEQIATLVEADLKFIYRGIEQVLKVPTSEELDELLARFGEAATKQQLDLLALVAIHPVSFSDRVWAWAESIARDDECEGRGLAFKLLACTDGPRFGKTLAGLNWGWSATERQFWVNHYGSGALIEATSAWSFDQIASRLAPWRLLEAVRRRGMSPNEIQMAARIVGHVLGAKNLEVPDLGSTLSVDRTDCEDNFSSFSIQPYASEEYANNPFAALKASMDIEAQRDAYRRAADTAICRIREAEVAGANLYLMDVATEDFMMVLNQAPEIVDTWLDGMVERSADFERRVRLAEEAYLSLCEALLTHDPGRGATLWYALRRTITTRFIGAAGVEEFLHIAFRAPSSPELEGMREDLLSLHFCNTDAALYDLALAATFNGKADWLASTISADQASPFAWRQKRAIVLSGFMSKNVLPVASAWIDGEVSSSYEALKRKSARLRSIEACAHDWWQVFLASKDSETAYAAWILDRKSVV